MDKIMIKFYQVVQFRKPC